MPYDYNPACGFITMDSVTAGSADRDRHDRQKRIDRVVYILCALAFAVSTFVVMRTELAMFLSGGGAA